MKIKNRKFSAIILAAGKGKRMKTDNINKASLPLNGKPLIAYPVELFQDLKIDPILIVVGHAKDSIQNALKDTKVIFAQQKKRLGTGHAVKKAMHMIPDSVTDIIILYGDDSYVYNRETLENLINIHTMKDTALTFLTIKVDNPSGLGRIIRDDSGEVFDIVEEKDASAAQKRIKEINPNCYIFKAGFLSKYLPKISKSPVTGEYYLPALVNLARENKEKTCAVDGGSIPWRGINTREDLEVAKNLFNKPL